jgi:flagellar biosynthesis chaperone FliJ
MTNEDLILQTLREIREDQKSIGEQLKMITTAQNRVETDLKSMRNGYETHEIVEMFHWISEQKQKEETRSKDIQRAVITWVIPLLLSALIVGFFQMGNK